MKSISDEVFLLAVCGAHLSDMPLNYQLTNLKATLLSKTRSADCYRLFSLAGQNVKKPGMIRDIGNPASSKIVLEVWEIPIRNVGYFLAQVPYPLSLGQIQLEDEFWVHGFICEKDTALKGEEITHIGCWRTFMNSV